MRNLNQFAELTTGVVYIHSSPVALCPHVEWALSSTLNARANLKWTAQEAETGLQRATVDWTGPVGTAARLVVALREWSALRFEVTEDASEGVDGERYSYVPGLGLWRGSMSANGDVVLGEMQLRSLLDSQPDSAGLAGAIEAALGTAWDIALEPFRMGGAGAEVTWLTQRVG
ncbi:DUF3145 family protein [Gordonia amarae]|uniref:DUF3145 domain-containing protein n=2 Tax=Gordonia amarae TaxID=36821 RepID=G7GPZ4_9ACTN|nr:DUF3145 domain-containing protein [Gordonia amarae]MCS3879687.1 hypothetical protein [Gordonia amarae]QHN18129.1 DUF3145 family protein [Gordonia amarae]QHN22650.1 DUF3145 family protein [Gordonia amarae]QHN31516.1 DUF3145 family protein [Gordonia amarae]QHN40260.1 DUF3145 family protein [Gordonia amarae]